MPEHDPTHDTTARQLSAAMHHAIAALGLNLDECSHLTHVHRGGTGEWDEQYPCTEPGTVFNLADDAPYCLRHHLKAEANREPRQSYAQRTLVISAADPDFA
jgi:hypothetical protein